MNVDPPPPDLAGADLVNSVPIPEWSRFVLQRLAASPEPPYSPAWWEWIVSQTWRILTQQWLARYGRAPIEGESRLRDVANDMLRYLLVVIHLYSLHDYAGPDR